MDWRRKHLCALASVCKDCIEDPALTISQRSEFAETYRLAKRFASFPNAGDVKNVTAAIAMACGACQAAFDHRCAGRYDWQQPCPLMQNHAGR